LREPGFEPPGVARDDLDTRLSGLTPSLTLDTRDNFFTPTRGGYLSLSAPLYREELGGDRDFELLSLSAMYFHPLGTSVFFGVRAAGKTSSDGTPFYLRPFVSLRGVQALQYQGEQAAEAELELRWQFRPRWSAVAFGGAGMARSDFGGNERERTVAAGGAGFRYLLARTYGLHMGVDVAVGPDEPVVYVVFGSQWLRP
jgi:outer membrane translocation and assembly module TamA